MNKQPLEFMLDQVEWKEIEMPATDGDLPYATHEGVLTILGIALRVYRLNTGQRIFREMISRSS